MPTKRKIQATLRESVFAPNKSGPLKPIADVGNVEYYIRRASELCAESLHCDDGAIMLPKLTKAISLLALAKVTFEDKFE